MDHTHVTPLCTPLGGAHTSPEYNGPHISVTRHPYSAFLCRHARRTSASWRPRHARPRPASPNPTSPTPGGPDTSPIWNLHNRYIHGIYQVYDHLCHISGISLEYLWNMTTPFLYQVYIRYMSEIFFFHPFWNISGIFQVYVSTYMTGIYLEYSIPML